MVNGMSKWMFFSKVFRIYDPLTLLVSVIVSLKLLLQALCKSKLTWDEKIPLDIASKYRKIRVGLPQILLFKIERISELQFHVFCDESGKAYSATLYVKKVDKKDKVSVKLFCANSRVAPIRTVSLPRMEICTAVLGANLASKVKMALCLDIHCQIYAWSDLSIIQYYLGYILRIQIGKHL